MVPGVTGRALRAVALAASLLLTTGSADAMPPAVGTGADVRMAIPLQASGAGSLTLEVELASEAAAFVVDTGAAMVSIERRLLKKLQKRGAVQPSHDVFVRLADGTLATVTVQRVSRLRLPGGCELHDLDVLVLPGEGRNLLGMNALRQFAPFTLRLDPLRLELSHCAHAPRTVAAVHAAH